MNDKTYAEWHRDCMARVIAEQDAEFKRKKSELQQTDYFVLRTISTVIVIAGLMALVLTLVAFR